MMCTVHHPQKNYLQHCGVMALILYKPSDVASYFSNIMKISLTVQSFRTNTIFILNIPKENNSEKKWWIMVLVLCILSNEAF